MASSSSTPLVRYSGAVFLIGNVSLQVQKSPVYRREGLNIHSDVFISVGQAILGGTAKAQGLYEPISMVVSVSAYHMSCLSPQRGCRPHLVVVAVQVPAGCQGDQVIRLEGKGIRKANSYSYGDHYAHIKIRVPK